jgi:hypothetical protein
LDWSSVEEKKKYFANYWQSHRGRYLIKQRQRRECHRQIVFEHYGKKCACCGENESRFLTLDHINNDGNTFRKSNRNLGGVNFYLHVARSIQEGNAPTDLQILCWNCNLGKAHNGGICPHRIENGSSE